MSRLRYIFSLALILLCLCCLAYAQRPRRTDSNKKGTTTLEVPIYKDTTKKVISDSLKAVLDSIHVADSLYKLDSIALMQESSLQAPAFSEAKDSIVENFSDGKQLLYYYGDVKVSYGNMTLTADYMEYDVQEQTVFARGRKDPATGEMKGEPVMTESGGGKSATYQMTEIKYNFKTRKAFIKNVVTNDDQGILHGKQIMMLPDQSVNITNGKYTVCDCEEPHYYLHMTAAKVMTKPTRNTVFGPAWPVVEGVPLFPIVLPFGFVPKRPERASGLLMPTFGEEQARGFYVRDMGAYFVFGDYFDFSLTGSYYSLGSWNIDFNSRYKYNYHFNGQIGITYSFDQVGEKGEPDASSSANFAVKWSHQMDSKAHPGASFSASVNFSSPSNSKYNSHSVQEALNNQISSSISYSRSWNGGKYNLSVNALHSQNSRDSSYAFTLPNITFSVSKFYPFKRKVRVGKEKLYEKFSLAYNTSFQNKINFKASEFKSMNVLDKMQNGMSHSFSIGLPSFPIFKYINVNPSLSYGMNWFFDSVTKEYVVTEDPETHKKTGEVVTTKGGAFSTFGITQDYSGSISMDTQVYGTFNFGKHHKIQAMRHIFKPSLQFNFSPDKAKYFNGYRTLEYTDVDGHYQKLDYNIYEGQMLSAPGKGSTCTASLTLGNNLEMKVRDYRDTTGNGSKKVKLLDQCNINMNYNFLADSLKMGAVGLTLATNVLGKVGINGNLNFSPYGLGIKNGSVVEINKFYIASGGSLLRLKNASLSLNYSLSGKGTINGNDGTKGDGGGDKGLPTYTRIYYHPLTGEYIPGGWVYYMNPNSPWSLNMSYSLGVNNSWKAENNQIVRTSSVTQTLSLSGNVKITRRLSISANTGVDLMALKITSTQISATYDLHCFNIQFSMVPFGQWKSWNFTIAANAAALSDLLRLKKSNSFWDNR